MIEAQKVKTVPMIFPAAIVDNDDPVGARGDANPVSVDTSGFDYAVIRLVVGATDTTVTASVYEGDSAASGADDADFTAISGADFGGAFGATDDNTVRKAFIDLRDKKGHLLVECLVGDGTTGAFVYADCDLYRAEQAPITAAGRGLGAQSIS